MIDDNHLITSSQIYHLFRPSSMHRIISIFIILCILIGAWFVYSEIYTASAQDADKVTFEIRKNETVAALADRLEKEHVVRNAWLFKKYIVVKEVDRQIREGMFSVEKPITLSRVVSALANPSVIERTITIIPGWDLRDIAVYFVKEGIASTTEDVYAVTGKPAVDYRNSSDTVANVGEFKVSNDKLGFVSYEGYLAPETYRIFKNASVLDIVKKLIAHRDTQFTDEMYRDIGKGGRTVYDIVTMASVLEREVQSKEDKAKAADIFWRRFEKNWALQADSTVHYAVGKKKEIFTTKEDRSSNSPWNTYKYPGLQLGPISNPSIESINAAIYPEKNDYWYFLTTSNGEVKYGKTLEEHNENVQKYLR